MKQGRATPVSNNLRRSLRVSGSAAHTLGMNKFIDRRASHTDFRASRGRTTHDNSSTTPAAPSPTEASGAMTSAEAARRMGVSEDMLRHMRYKNQGPSYLKMGRAVRYLQKDIDAWWASIRVVTEGQDL